MNLLAFFNVLILGFLITTIGLGTARYARSGWKPYPYLLSACIVWIISRFCIAVPSLIPEDYPYYLPSAEALGLLFLAWFTVEEENFSAIRSVKAAIAILLAIFSLLIINALMPLRYEFLPAWVYPAAGCIVVTGIFIIWLLRKSDPPHFLLQGFVFLALYAAAALIARQTTIQDNLFHQINSLALTFAFFSIAIHVGYELLPPVGVSITMERLVSFLAEYLSLYHSYLKSRAELKKGALYDPLTLLQNFSAFQVSLNKAIQDADKNSTSFALVFFDIDHFSSINDQVGFETGDRILRTLGAGVLRAVEPNFAGRIGGDEFAIILHDDENVLQQRIEDMSADLHRELEAIDGKTEVNVLAAYAVYPYDFFEQSGVFRRMRNMLGTSDVHDTPIRVKCG